MAHFIDEPRPKRCQRAGSRQGLDRVAGLSAPMHESLSRCRVGGNVLARAPEVSDRQARVGALQEVSGWMLALSAWGVGEAVTSGIIEVVEIKQGAKFDTLESVVELQGEGY